MADEHEATERTMAARTAFLSLDFQWLRFPNPASDQVPIEPANSEVERRTRIYKNVMRLRGYRRDLDIVAVAKDGEFVAFCTCWLDTENKTGLFEPVGCVPGYRRRGLSQTVFSEGLRRLKALGAESAVVGTNPLNVPAIRLYESCGFRISFTDFTYCKTLKD
jgi:ribosomal protein S18 acetylase RimI-like enzyme